MAHLHDLVEEDSTITSSTTGVDYRDYDYHKDDDAMPSFLFILDSLSDHLQTQLAYLELMKRKRQGVANIFQYPLHFDSMYV